MRNFIMTTVGAVALLGFAAPASAQYYNWDNEHARQHDHLADHHDDIHDQLDEQHREAHEEGLSPWEHAQLHEDLQYQHDRADYQLALQHQREHRRDEWRRRYRGHYGYGYRQAWGY